MKNYLFITLTIIALSTGCTDSQEGEINRKELVDRHQVNLDSLNDMAPLSVGNGHFCYTADITGMQTFTDYYSEGIPLTTMSEWGWHSFPDTVGYEHSDTYVEVPTDGRMVSYPIDVGNPASAYLRANPHQTTLGLIGLEIKGSNGEKISIDEIEDIDQTLDLWSGRIISKFSIEGEEVEVITVCHPESDQLAFRIRSSLLSGDRLGIKLRFPYAAGTWGMDPADFSSPEKHTTTVTSDKSGHSVMFSRAMDDKKYFCEYNSSVPMEMTRLEAHHFLFTPIEAESEIELTLSYAENENKLTDSSYGDAIEASKESWEKFWTSGGAVDLSGSSDDRWMELERRIVLSQYLTAIQSNQKYPPQEAGLTNNSWFGKFHLEMHWWHSVHFAYWNRMSFLENSLDWYSEILPRARETAQRQGYSGARWPKMVGPDGIDSPSNVGPLLIWQQPHPIFYAELVYRNDPGEEVLERFSEIIENTADFMASFASWNQERECYELGPPLISAREFSGRTYSDNKNPTYELAYWTWGLRKANEWRERMGLERNENWDKVADNMAPWPVYDGFYVEQEQVLVRYGGHPCMLAAYGILPESEELDKEIMSKTLRHVMDDWDWENTWGWDYPMIAMTATRLGEPEIAIEALLKDVTKNTYLPNGHVYQRDGLHLYLPGNGGLLSAVAMMCAGWDGAPEDNAPGFPDEGWTVRWEGLDPAF